MVICLSLSLSHTVSLSPSFLSSGLVVPESRGNETVPEVVTTSGYALLHFFSDAAYNLTGFTIAYSYVYTSDLFHSFFLLHQCFYIFPVITLFLPPFL